MFVPPLRTWVDFAGRQHAAGVAVGLKESPHATPACFGWRACSGHPALSTSARANTRRASTVTLPRMPSGVEHISAGAYSYGQALL